ncbi:MAG: hypothetical protein GXZ10_13385 [Gammaproteobacteria bacterium]|nr:hypothetical protein [Gammaproteobacteria bacterium]
MRADAPVDFSSKADAMVGALQPFADEANILAEFVSTRADNAATSASTVAGVQSAVSADRVLSQQAASNAAGSAAAAASSASTANSRATAAQLSADASEASAVRAEIAAEYVEDISGGAAPINNPNFQGVVKVNDAPLGTAATADLTTSNTDGTAGRVLKVGDGGWMGMGEERSDPYEYPASVDDATNQTKVIYSRSIDNGVSTFAAGIHFASRNSWGRLRVGHYSPAAWIQGGLASSGTGWTSQVVLSANLLQTTGSSVELPMSQAATTAAIDDVIQNIDDGSGPRPTKDHGDVAVSAAETVTCDVQESDFHIMSLGSSNTSGTLTIDFSNMPDTIGKHFSWHVRLQRGGRKTVAFAQTVNWAGGVAPTFGTGTTSRDLMLFYKVDSETIRGMVIDAW